MRSPLAYSAYSLLLECMYTHLPLNPTPSLTFDIHDMSQVDTWTLCSSGRLIFTHSSDTTDLNWEHYIWYFTGNDDERLSCRWFDKEEERYRKAVGESKEVVSGFYLFITIGSVWCKSVRGIQIRRCRGRWRYRNRLNSRWSSSGPTLFQSQLDSSQNRSFLFTARQTPTDNQSLHLTKHTIIDTTTALFQLFLIIDIIRIQFIVLL